ncbi:twin-arginine translocation signal domain-containing protein [Haladaptatus sp. NG-SE-30]
MTRKTRRQFIKGAGALTVASVGVSSLGTSTGSQSGGWQEVKSPTKKTLSAVVDTVEGPFAVGGGGDVLARRKNGWQKVVEYGPQARSRPLTAVDVTDDGKRIWFVGGSGVIGEYDVETETLTNYSAPKGKTSTWEDVAVRGTGGENERLYFVNGSGELLVGIRQDSGAMKYKKVVKPGGGSTIPGIDFHARKKGHVCSTSQFVAETTNGGDKWKRIGIDFAGQNFFDITSVGIKDVNVAGGGGIVYRYDGFRWTPHVIDDGRQAIRSIDRDKEAGPAAGSGGKVYDRISKGQWKRINTPVSTQLRGVSHGKSVDVAVGSGGTVVERATDDGSGGTTTTTKTSTSTSTSTSTTTAMALPSLAETQKTVKQYLEGEWV